MTKRILRPCPYRRFMRNVHVRRAFILFAGPVVAIILIFLTAAMGIREGMLTFLDEALEAFNDGNSYD